ncbi:putative protein kinase RLK-Pelle-PERK-2 family [Rosa chinensis]|uniref:Protein kinase domain-containing protein n=1 Tax=Rosa chinensis TaxID=74649 RepID=A0A2P6PD76_ROSCH|nr:putative protein kinase RLK-Pelle-PERK-2 family [Rosa chinensis]
MKISCFICFYSSLLSGISKSGTNELPFYHSLKWQIKNQREIIALNIDHDKGEVWNRVMMFLQVPHNLGQILFTCSLQKSLRILIEFKSLCLSCNKLGYILCSTYIEGLHHFRKSQLFLRGHVSCSIAVMKGKDFATLMLSEATPPDIFPGNSEESYNSAPTDNPMEVSTKSLSPDQLTKSHAPASHRQNPCCYPMSWRTGFPRVFSHNEIEVITNGFADDYISKDIEGLKVYLGILQDTTVLVKSYEEVNKCFRSMLVILSRVCHRNIMNLVGYCYTGAAAYLIFDFPCLGNMEYNLRNEELAQKLGWKTRWYIALEIGGSLRYLHEECADGSIVHKSVCSCSVSLSHDYSAMVSSDAPHTYMRTTIWLSRFTTAEWLAECVPHDEDLIASLFVDVRGYGKFLLELITGKSACSFPNQGKDQSMIDWVRSLGQCKASGSSHLSWSNLKYKFASSNRASIWSFP